MKTRFAPSPTGSLHVGGARTALFNWLFAKRAGGTFVVRIDDTDPERSNEAHIESILDDLAWLGLDWQEGPDVGGDYGPYVQSERGALYTNLSERLLYEGSAYRCYCSKERLKELSESQRAQSSPPRYDRKCLKAFEKAEAPPEGVTPCVRFRVPERTIIFKDGLRGTVSFRGTDIGDFVILGSDGVATYNFASAVDDSMMQITDVIRGEDHISNTPRQIMLMEALGLDLPNYTHLPLVIGTDRKPLSKREGGLSIPELRKEGYFSGAVVNTLIRLGWAPREGYLSIEEIIVAFQADRLSKSPAVFDKKVLNRFNRELMKQLGPEDLLDFIVDDFEGVERERLLSVIRALREDVSAVGEITRMAKGFFGEVEYSADAEKLLKGLATKRILRGFAEEVEKVDELTEEKFRDIMKRLKLTVGDQKLFMYIRAALTGATSGIELEKIMQIIGKKKALERAHKFF